MPSSIFLLLFVLFILKHHTYHSHQSLFVNMVYSFLNIPYKCLLFIIFYYVLICSLSIIICFGLKFQKRSHDGSYLFFSFTIVQNNLFY